MITSLLKFYFLFLILRIVKLIKLLELNRYIEIKTYFETYAILDIYLSYMFQHISIYLYNI